MNETARELMMDIEWIEPFRRDMSRLYQEFVDMASDYVVVHPSEAKSLETLHEKFEIFYPWSQALLSNQAVWELMDLRSLLHEVISNFVVIANYLELMGVIRTQVEPWNESAVVHDLANQTKKLIQTLQQAAQHAATPLISLMDLPRVLNCSSLIAIVRTTMPRLMFMSEMAGIDDWPLVVYHPFFTTELLYSLMIRLGLAGQEETQKHRCPSFFVAYTPRFFEISFTVASLILTPVIWEPLLTELKSLQKHDCLEYLREMGGEIEPLTWNEGHGEGVIVRLPWARGKAAGDINGG